MYHAVKESFQLDYNVIVAFVKNEWAAVWQFEAKRL